MPQVRRPGASYLATGYFPAASDTAGRRGALALLDQDDPAFHYITHAVMELSSYGFDIDDPEILQRAIDRGRERYTLRAGHLEATARKQGRATTPTEGELVYYFRIGNRCKIGYSSNLAARLTTLNPEELLATEPGTYALEQLRHSEFSQLRTHGEWFRLEPPLTEHIAALRQKHGQAA